MKTCFNDAIKYNGAWKWIGWTKLRYDAYLHSNVMYCVIITDAFIAKWKKSRTVRVDYNFMSAANNQRQVDDDGPSSLKSNDCTKRDAIEIEFENIPARRSK